MLARLLRALLGELGLEVTVTVLRPEKPEAPALVRPGTEAAEQYVTDVLAASHPGGKDQ